MTKDELNQRYDPMNRAELIAECERLRAALAIVTKDRDTLLEMSGHTLEQVARRIEKLGGGTVE